MSAPHTKECASHTGLQCSCMIVDIDESETIPFDDEPEDEMELADLNCGELPEGGCSLAGTEWCDWSCPFSDGMTKRMNEKPE